MVTMQIKTKQTTDIEINAKLTASIKVTNANAGCKEQRTNTRMTNANAECNEKRNSNVTNL